MQAGISQRLNLASARRTVSAHLLCFACLCCILCVLVVAQDAIVPTVTFSCDFPGADPEHYAISIASDGNSSYRSDGKLNRQSEADPFHLDFAVSQPTRTRVFDLAKRAHYFEGKVDSGKKNIASSGVKVLTYKDAQKTTQATYNYSPIQAVQDLTSLLQSLSATLEFGRRLEYYHRFQKLALDDELKTMEDMAHRNSLEEIDAVGSILQAIVEDPSLMNVVRARAQRLMSTSK
ncbi:MAG: hypothetical protein JWO91_932 [Acidobacteriaceae bacterium]|nr:hypothetical protein [Acidobacteriaceae bacterium]